MRIDVDLSDAKLIIRKGDSESDSEHKSILLESDIVSGCEDSKMPTGKFKAGKFIKDKTNNKFGPVPWSEDPWGNPYGPYFLQILNLKGIYTAYGIHGTRGGDIFDFVAPPMPQWMFGWFVDDDTEKYSYCSHGCIRISNRNIKKVIYSCTRREAEEAKRRYLHSHLQVIQHEKIRINHNGSFFVVHELLERYENRALFIRRGKREPLPIQSW